MDIKRIKQLAGVITPVAIKPVATLVKEFHNIRMSEELDFKRTAKEFGAVSVVLKEQNGFTVAVVTFDEATLTESEEKYKAFLAETKMTAAQKKERSEKIDDKDSENEKEADECKVASEETKEVSEKSAESEEVKESANNTIEIVEVSKKMLGSYIKKSTDPNDERSVLNLASKGAYKLAKAENSEDDGYKEDSKAVKRAASIAKAVNKITKQEESTETSEEVKESKDSQLAETKSSSAEVSESGNNNFLQTVDDSKNELNTRMGVDVERKAKVIVPAVVKASIAARIKELKQAIADYDEKGYNDQSQKTNAIDALEQILDNLSSGDVEGFKKAQIFHSTLMSPITDLFPSNLMLFLADAKIDWLDKLK